MTLLGALGRVQTGCDCVADGEVEVGEVGVGVLVVEDGGVIGEERVWNVEG